MLYMAVCLISLLSFSICTISSFDFFHSSIHILVQNMVLINSEKYEGPKHSHSFYFIIFFKSFVQQNSHGLYGCHLLAVSFVYL